MNIFCKDALKRMKNSRARTLVTIVGVALSTALITAVATFAVSLQDYMVRGAIEKYGDWQVSFPDVDAAFVKEQAEDSRVEKVVVCESIGYGALDGGRNPHKPYVYVMGFSEEAFEELPLTLAAGRLPENSREILIPAHVALNGGVKFSLGDTLTLKIGDRVEGDQKLTQHDPYVSVEEPESGKESLSIREERFYTVVGICQRPAFEERTAPGYTLITAMNPASSGERADIFVTLKKAYQVHGYTKLGTEDRTYVLNDDVLRFMGLSKDRVFQMLLYSVGGVLLLLIMTGSVFLIYNAFNISLNERMHQFGILLSVGATEKQLRKSVLFEGLCIGAAGIPLGIFIGLPSLQVVLALASGHFQNIMYEGVPLKLCVSPLSLLAAVAISLVTILISAYLPARKAAATPVMECIRQSRGVKLEARAIRVPKYAMRICGLEGTLALKNFRRNRRRYRSIMLSLTLSVVLFISANTFQTELGLFAEQSKVEADGDILFTARDMEEEELLWLYEKLKQASGVTESTYQILTTYSCRVPVEMLTPEFRENGKQSGGFEEKGGDAELLLDIQFLEDGRFVEFLESQGLALEDYTGAEASMAVVGKRTGSQDLFTEPSFAFTIQSQENGQTKDIRGSFVDAYLLDPPPAELSEVKDYVFMGILPYSARDSFAFLQAPQKECLTFWSENPGQSEGQMKTLLEGAGITCPYELYNMHKLLEENRNMEFIVRLFTMVFVGMISLIAMANVFNTISTNIKLRRRELAMLRSVGMGDRAFHKMMRLECFFYGAGTLLFGLPLAVLCSFLIYQWLVWGGATVAFVFPWASLGISVLGVFFMIALAMLYAVSKIKKENIIDALRDDMT